MPRRASRIGPLFLSAALLIVHAGWARAQVRQVPLTFRAYAVGSHIAGESAHEEGLFVSYRAEGTKVGAGLGMEYRPRTSAGSPGRWGFSIDVLDTSFDLKARVNSGPTVGTAHDKVRLRPVLLGASYHLPLRTDAADVWFGPSLAWVQYSNAAFSVGVLSFPERFQSTFGWGLSVGTDVPFGSARRGFLTGALRTLAVTSDARGPSFFKLDLDPVMVTLGVGYRY